MFEKYIVSVALLTRVTLNVIEGRKHHPYRSVGSCIDTCTYGGARWNGSADDRVKGVLYTKVRNEAPDHIL